MLLLEAVQRSETGCPSNDLQDMNEDQPAPTNPLPEHIAQHHAAAVAAKYANTSLSGRALQKKMKAMQMQQRLEVLKRAAVTAVHAGLTDPTDNYKRAGIGCKTLQGLGIFNADVQMNLTVTMPVELESGYELPPAGHLRSDLPRVRSQVTEIEGKEVESEEPQPVVVANKIT